MNIAQQALRPGHLNPEFNGGKVGLDHTGAGAFLLWLEQTTSGNILVLSRRIGEPGFYLSRFTAEGTLDAAFAAGQGFFYFEHPLAPDRTRFHVLDDGAILVTGGSHTDLLVVTRFHQDGSLDMAYGIDGHATVAVSELVFKGRRGAQIQAQDPLPAQQRGLPPKTGNSISVADGNGLYQVFTVGWGGYETLLTVVVRLDAEGELDRQFKGSGYVTVTLAAPFIMYNFATDAVLQGEAGQATKLVVMILEAQPQGAPKAGARFLVRYDAQGQLDYRFGGTEDYQGFVRIDGTDFYATGALWSDAAGKLKVLGGSIVNETVIHAAIRGYTAQGRPDLSFNDGQLLRTEVAPGYSFWDSGAFYGEGDGSRMVLTTTVVGDTVRIGVVRLLGDGSFDGGFADQGMAVFDPVPTGVFTLAQLKLLPNTDILLGYQNNVWWLRGGETPEPPAAQG